ncbi:MAG: MAPEG family protein [Jannaschia sp.]
MTLIAISIIIYALLIFGVVAIQAGYASVTAGTAFGFSNRDAPQPGMGPAGRRIDRTLGNLKEGAIMYLPLAITAVALDISNGWTFYAALATILSRVLYVLIFLVGIQTIRTFVWVPSFAAIPAMAVGIMVGQPL